MRSGLSIGQSTIGLIKVDLTSSSKIYQIMVFIAIVLTRSVVPLVMDARLKNAQKILRLAYFEADTVLSGKRKANLSLLF